MSKYRAKLPRYKRGKGFKQRDSYRILDLYKRPNVYAPRGYRSGAGMRRGYNSGLYFPSRRPYSYPTQSAVPSYRPTPRLAQRPASYAQSSHSTHYRHPTRIEPYVEEMLKELEQRFDKKLEERELERMEEEFKELQEALGVKSEPVENSDKQEQEIESTMSETAKQESKEANAEATEVSDGTYDEAELYGTKLEKEEQTKAEAPEAEELPIENKLFETEDNIEWLKEQVDESELPEPRGEADEPEPTLEQTLGALANQGLEQQQAVEVNASLDEIAPLEEPVAIEPEQLADLELLLDQIEPIEPDIEPIQAGIESLPGLLPEPMEEAVEEEAEGEAY